MMLNSNTMNLIENIIRCYSAFGERPSSFNNRKFSFYVLPRWRNAVMSPIYLRKDKVLNERDLRQLEIYFNRNPAKSKHDASTPYFQKLITPKHKCDKHLEKFLKIKKWSAQKELSTLNYWTTIQPFKLPSSLHLRVGSYFDSGLQHDFRTLLKLCFKRGDTFVQNLEFGIRTVQENTHVVLFYNKQNKPCACGLVTWGKSGGFLWCGAVAPQYRSRGYWRQLVAARQMISARYGVNFWITTTSNPRIAGNADGYYKIMTFKKL